MPTQILVILFVFALVGTASAQDKWHLADRETKRLSPDAFVDLPRKITKFLKGRKCTIPQSYMVKNPHNVIRGQFARQGQTDWAVLCSVNRRSSIIIFWNGSIEDRSEIARVRDYDFLQGITGDGEIGFSRVIESVGGRYIDDHYKEHGGAKPPRITHQGINDIFAEKASVVRYFHHGKWLELQGAD